jgi:hypothetical protein
VLITFVPKFKGIAAEGLPDVTAVPFTVTVAVGSAVVGVSVKEDTTKASFSV